MVSIEHFYCVENTRLTDMTVEATKTKHGISLPADFHPLINKNSFFLHIQHVIHSAKCFIKTAI